MMTLVELVHAPRATWEGLAREAFSEALRDRHRARGLRVEVERP